MHLQIVILLFMSIIAMYLLVIQNSLLACYIHAVINCVIQSTSDKIVTVKCIFIRRLWYGMILDEI